MKEKPPTGKPKNIDPKTGRKIPRKRPEEMVLTPELIEAAKHLKDDDETISIKLPPDDIEAIKTAKHVMEDDDE